MYHLAVGAYSRDQIMNLICILPFLLSEFSFYNCLKINEIKIEHFLSINDSPDKIKDKDFLDVDVASDIVPSLTTIYDVPSEPV